MISFATRLTVYLCGTAAAISFVLTGAKAFSDIEGFHGGWLDFIFYLGNGLLDSGFNGAVVFCVSGIVVLPVLRYIEKEMNETLKKKKLQEMKVQNSSPKPPEK
jgi:hypothetical protein